MLNIISGKISRAQKVVFYGPEGSGKSTLASKSPNPLFIDTEGGTAQLDVRRVNGPADWEDLISIVNEVSANPEVCDTLVVDTADWAEAMCIDYVCKKYRQNSIESFGYGKGYTYVSEEFGRLLATLDGVIAAGINVIVTAHAKMRKFEQPDEAGAYDRWEMKLSRQVAPLLKEWCDLLLFINYKTYVVTTESNVKKAQGGKRVMYASHHPCWDAKNRHGLPDEMDLDFSNIAHLFTSAPAENTEPVKSVDQLFRLMDEAGISDEEFRRFVASKNHYPAETPITEYSEKFLAGWCIKHFKQIANIITADPDRLPKNKEE